MSKMKDKNDEKEIQFSDLPHDIQDSIIKAHLALNKIKEIFKQNNLLKNE
jgi:hypothetical protein